MKFDKVLPTLKSLAPTIATAIGGPFAGMGVTVLAKALGIDIPDPDAPEAEDKLTKAVQGMSPETMAAVRKADQDFQVRLRQLDIDVEKLRFDDIASARNMQVQTRDWTPRILAMLIVLGFFTLLGLMAFVELPLKNEAAMNIMLGTLGAAFGAVYQFFFGSSASSQAKDATIRELKK